MALQAARMGNWTWDAKTDRVNLPDRAAEIFGVPHDTVVTWSAMQEWLHPEDAASANAAFKRAAKPASNTTASTGSGGLRTAP